MATDVRSSSAASVATAVKSSHLRWWYVAVPLLIITMIGQMDKMSISVIMSNKQFLKDLNLTGRPALVGMIMTGFLFSYSLFHFVWGPVVKKIGPRTSAIIGILMWAFTLVLSGLAQTAGAMITARVILGIGEASMIPISNTFVANWFPVKERGKAGSFWLNGFSLGPMISGALVVAIVAAGGWRMVFFALAALSVLIPLPMVIFLMKDHPRQQKRISEAEAVLIEGGSLMKTKEVPHDAIVKKEGYLGNYRFWLVTIAWGLNNIYWFGWTTWMPTYFQTVRHFSFHATGFMYSGMFLVGLLAIWIVGIWSDKIVRRAPFATITFLLTGITMYIGGSSHTMASPFWAFIVLGVSLCGDQAAFSMIHALLQSIVPERSMGSATGVAGGVSMLMAVPAPWFIGLIVGLSGFEAVVICLALSALLAGLLTSTLIKQGY